MARDCLIALLILRCSFAETPVTRRGRIFPVSEVNLPRTSVLSGVICSTGMSCLRRVIWRFALRKLIRRWIVFGSDIILAEFAVKGSALEEVVKLHFFKTTWRTQALFVARRDVTGRRLALGFRFGAFKDYNLAWHDSFGGGRILPQSSSPSSETVTDCSSSCGIPPLKPTSSEGRNLRLPYSFSHCAWHSTVKRAKGIASSRAVGIL